MTDKGEPKSLSRVIATNIQQTRLDLGLTQTDVANLLGQVGLAWTDITVAKVERGSRECKASELFALGLVLGLSPAQLVATDSKRVQLGSTTRVIPSEALTIWARDTSPTKRQRAEWKRAAETEPDTDDLSGITEAGRALAAAMRRITPAKPASSPTWGDMPGTFDDLDRTVTFDALGARRRVARELGEWVAAETAKGNEVTPRRRRGMEAWLWSQVAEEQQ